MEWWGRKTERLGDGSRPASHRHRRPAAPIHTLLLGQAGR